MVSSIGIVPDSRGVAYLTNDTVLSRSASTIQRSDGLVYIRKKYPRRSERTASEFPTTNGPRRSHRVRNFGLTLCMLNPSILVLLIDERIGHEFPQMQAD